MALDWYSSFAAFGQSHDMDPPFTIFTSDSGGAGIGRGQEISM